MSCIDLREAVLPESVGQKAARLGEVFAHYPIPSGFVLQSSAYQEHVKDLPLAKILSTPFDVTDLDSLIRMSSDIRTVIQSKPIADNVLAEVQGFASKLKEKIVVRSSSIQEDTAELSFAGQYDSFLDLDNKPETLEHYIKLCWASLYTPRAISYRHHNRLKETDLSIAVLVQNMVYGVSGVVFSVNPNSGGEEVLIEFHRDGVVQGKTNAQTIHARKGEQFYNYRDLKIDDQKALLQHTYSLVEHFKYPLDIEWVKSEEGLHILQVRPLKIMRNTEAAHKPFSEIPILIGSSVGSGIISGVVQKVEDPRQKVKDGSILVVKDTSPEWEPLMRRAKALITDHGSRTSHASLVAGEMKLPAIVGTSDATWSLVDGQLVTLDSSLTSGSFMEEFLSEP